MAKFVYLNGKRQTKLDLATLIIPDSPAVALYYSKDLTYADLLAICVKQLGIKFD